MSRDEEDWSNEDDETPEAAADVRQITLTNQSIGCVPLSDGAWEQILRTFRMVYRPADAEERLREELEGYHVLTKSGKVAVGSFVRYMRKGLIDVGLRRGGYVDKCNSKTIQLQDGHRRWRVSRADNFIFVRVSRQAPIGPKRPARILVEELLCADDQLRQINVRK